MTWPTASETADQPWHQSRSILTNQEFHLPKAKNVWITISLAEKWIFTMRVLKANFSLSNLRELLAKLLKRKINHKLANLQVSSFRVTLCLGLEVVTKGFCCMNGKCEPQRKVKKKVSIPKMQTVWLSPWITKLVFCCSGKENMNILLHFE